MSFSEWSFRKQKKQQEEENSLPATPSTSSNSNSNTGIGLSFTEWSNDKNASKSVEAWANSSSGLIQEIQTHYSGWSGGDYAAMRNSTYDTRLNSYLSLAEDWRKQYAGNNEVLSYIDSVESSLRNAQNYNSQSFNYYSQWGSADEYNTYERQSTNDLDAIEKEIKELEAIYADYANVSAQYNNLVSGGIMAPSRAEEILTQYEAYSSQYGSLQELDARITEREVELNQSRRVQEGITYSGVVNNADFNQHSGYQTTIKENPAAWESGIGDTQYEWINNQNGFRDEWEQSHSDLSAMAVGTSQTGMYLGPTESPYKEKGYDYLTEDEIAIYNYYYSRYGKDKAQEYLDSIQESLNYRKATGRYEVMQGDTAAELVFGIEAGTDQFAQGLRGVLEAMSGDADYIPTSSTQYLSGMVREDLADDGVKLPDWLGGASLGQVGYDAITTTSNMAPTIITSTIMNAILPGSGGVVGSALLGASAGGNAYQEALNAGYDKDQAIGYALLVGGSEAGLQYLLGGIESLGGSLSGNAITSMLNGIDNAFLRTAGKIGANMLSEGFEEGLQEVLTPWFKNLTLHTNEDINWSEVAYSSLLGALTAGVMEGPSTVGDSVNTYNTGKQLQNAGITGERLSQIGNTFSADTVAYQLAGRVNENTGAYTMGRLFNEIGATMTEQNVNDITEALVAKGMDEATARKNAQAMAVVVEGDTLTDLQVAVIESNEALAEAVRTTIIDPNATWFQRTKGYNEALMALAQEKTAPKASQTNPAEAGQENVPAADKVDTQNKNVSEVDTSPAKVSKITSIKDGNVTIKLEDGSEVNAVDADLAPEDGVIIETIAKIGGISVNDANHILGMIKAAPGVNSQWSALGANEAYKYGFYGMSEEHMTKHGVFTNSLTDTQRKAIYETGRNARQTQVDAKQVAVSKKETTAQNVSGKVHFDGDRSSLTERQSASLSAMEKIADILGVQIHVFESKVGKNGKRIGANGWYDPKDNSIHIDLHSGANGEGTMLFTLAHELTHHIRKWSPAKFKILADFLMEEYGKKGVNVDGLVREQMAKAKRNGRTISYDTAYEEVVADSVEMMLSDGNVMKRLEKLKARDQDLWHKIKNFIDDLAAKIRNVYKDLRPDSVEGRYVADMGKAVYKLQELFADALVDASENYQSSLTPGEEGVITNQNGDPVAYSTEDGSVLLSMRTYEEDGRKAFKDYLQKCVKSKKLTKAEMQEMLDGIEEIYGICKEFKDKYAPFSSWSDAAVVRDTHGKPVFSVVTPNGDYKMNPDFSLVCKKRRTLDAVFNEMSRRGIIDDFELGQKSVVKINEIIRKYGLETACALCFVDAKRFRQASMADQFTRLYNELVESLVPEDQKGSIDHFNFSGYATIKKVEGGIDTWANSKLDFSHLDHVMKTYGDGTVEYKAAKYIKNNPQGRKLLLRGDFMSSQGFDAVKTQNQDILKLYNSKKGTGGPKAAFGDVQYMNEIIQKARWWTPKKAYEVGGIRIQSFSDYVPRMVFDYVQMIYDLAATKLPAHAYTKEALFVKQFGLTGVKINMSLIPAIAEGGIAPGLDANGNYVWAGESFDFETAKEIQNAPGYTENCGTICVGVSYKHIVKLLGDPNIRMVIPYHKSGLNPIVAHMNKIAEFTDYTTLKTNPGGCQNTIDKNGSKVEMDFNFNETLRKTGDPKATVRQYLDWCSKHEYTPRFAEFAWHENYYKLIEDFTLFDKDGNYVPQREVRAVFPKETDAFGSMKDLIKEGLEEDAVVEGKRDARLSSIVDEIQRTIPKTEAEISEEQVTQADRDLEAEEISDTHVKWSLREEAPPKKTMIGYKAFFVKDGKLYPPMVANPSGAGTPVGVWLNADTGSPMRDSEGNIVQNQSGRAKVAAGGKGTKGGGGSLAWRPGWHLGPIPDATQFSVDPASKEWSEWLKKSGLAAGDSKNIGNKGQPIFLNPHIVFAEVEFAADVDYQLEAYEYGVKKNGKFDHSQAGIPYVIKDGYYRYRTNSMAPGALSWYITGSMKVNRILTDAECREICAKSGRDMMPRLGGDFDFTSHALTAGDVTPTEDLSSVAPKQDFSDEVLKLPGYVRRALNFSDPNFRKAFEDDSIADKLEYYENLYNETDSKKFSDRDNAPTFYSHMARVVDGVKQEKLGAASVVSMLRGKGVKAEEIKWSGIETWLEGKKSVTKAELQEFIAGSMLQIGEQTSGTSSFVDEDGNAYTETEFRNRAYEIADEQGIDRDRVKFILDGEEMHAYVGNVFSGEILSATGVNGARWSDYKLDGGENYREIVFTLPNSTYSNQMMRIHWGDDAEGVLAHARVQDFNVNGKKMLFIEEIQSDYHNEGHQSGYADSKTEAEIDRLKAIADERFFALEDYSTEETGMAGEWEAMERTVKGSRLLLEYTEARDAYDKAMNEFVKKIPDAPFKDTYHEYVMKRLLRMAAEQGYDSIGWTPAEIQVKRWSEEYAEGYRIEYDQDIPKFLSKYGKKWGAKIGKTPIPGLNSKSTFYDVNRYETFDSFTEWQETVRSTLYEQGANMRNVMFKKEGGDWIAYDKQTGIEYDRATETTTSDSVWYMPITDSMKESVLAEGQPLYSDRDTESVSNRSLLANAFEGVAQNDIEKQKIQEYKGKISLIESEERKLAKLNEQIKDLSFAKGPKDTKAIKSLQFEAKQTANRISTYDKQLLRLEASKPLQDVLQREKKMAYQRAEKKGKEALEAYREKTMKTQRDLMDKWKESRKKGIESREKTAMRHKIKDVVNELNQYLLRGTKDRHVPESLQKAVAEALDAVNMDTVGAEERIAKLQAELLKAKTPEDIQEISRKIDHIREMGDKMNGRLKKLKDAYDDLLKSPDENTRNSYDAVIHNKLDSVIDKIGNTALRDMTLAQLEDVYDMYRMVLKAIRDVNKSFKDAKKQSISTRANAVMAQVEEVGGKHKSSPKILNGIKKFGWNNLKPVYFFEHIGSVTLTEAFNNVRKGEDVWALDVTEARAYYLDKSKKHNYDSWDFNKRYKFTSTSGMDFDLNLEQILSLYAYSKRDQAADHLKYGGIVFDESTKIIKKTKLGISLEYNPTEATAYNISEETLADIISKLTDEQKAFADEMQDYLSTVMGAKGNEVSMAMYDIRLFKDKNYFPLKSAQQFMEKVREQQKGDVKIKNSGFSKETVPHAKNPIVLTPFMEVWSNHVNEMSMYHAFVLPLEDFYRIYNYKTPSNNETLATEGVNEYIQNAYERGATAYIDQLLKDLNGGARTDSTTGIINKMMGLFKKGSVFASLSVVVQQPSAIARAAALVDTKYFIGPKVDHKRHKALWDEVKQYAPVAIIKEMGYFDTNMGKSTQDFILGKEYRGISEKMKALVKDSNYRDEILSKAPALADELAWCSIWEAVKREMHDKHPGLDVKGEPFLMLAGSRFTEVITKTQVYDSVLSRSANMRSKDTGMKMATSFMAEPTTSINMIADALLQGKRGNKKYARAAIGAVIASQIINSILVSFVYAGRDDDEDETYWEKYIGTLTGEMIDSLNPLTYIPFIKDFISITQGYDVERSDMAIISDLWNAYQQLGNEDMSGYRKFEVFVGSVAQIFGLPVKNIMRDGRGIYQTVMSFTNGQQTTKAGVEYAVRSALPAWMGGGDVSNQNQLYEAIISGDQVQIARVESRFKDQNAITSAIRKALRENDPRIHEAAVAKSTGNLDEYMRIAREIIGEGHFSQDDVVAAINAEINDMSKDDTASSSQKASGLFKAEDFAEAISQGDQAMANAIKTDIIQTAQKNGKTAEEAEKSFNSSAKSELKEMFLSGEISEQEIVNALVTYCGADKDEAQADVQYWLFKENNPDVYADDSWFDAYYEYAAGSGISIDVYMDYRNRVVGITGEGKKERRMAVIDSLPITSAQKDALYYAEGWAESKLYEAPWH